MGAFGDLLNSQGFQLGFVLSVIAMCIVGTLVLVLPPLQPKRRGLVGPAWVVTALLASAGWFGLPQSGSVPWYVPVGLIVTFAGAELGARGWGRRTVWRRVALLAPGATVLAFGEGWSRPNWLSWMVLLGVAVGSPLVEDFDRRTARLGLGPVLFAVSLVGAFLYLPENDLVRALLGAAIPLALVGVPFRLARLGNGGTAVTLGLYFWAIAYEAQSKPIQSWIMIFALGLPLVEPVGRWYARSLTHRSVPWHKRRRYLDYIAIGANVPTVGLQATVVLVDLAFVLYVSRFVGFSERYLGDSAMPTVLLLPVVLGGTLMGAVLGLSPHFRYRSIRLDSRGGLRSRHRRRRVAGSSSPSSNRPRSSVS